MTTQQPVAVGGHAEALLSLDDLCRTCAVQAEFVVALLEEGVAQPAEGQTAESWRFSEVQVCRVSVAWRLQRDLGVNPAGAGLALALLDELETLRAQLARLDPTAQDPRP